MIISSILDTDLYKLTMQQAVIAHYPDERVRYELIIRTQREFPAHFADILREEVTAMSHLRLTDSESAYLLQHCPYFKRPYIDFLKGYRFNPDEVTVYQTGGFIRLFVEGYWYRTILWEVPLLAIVSELFFKLTEHKTCTTQERSGCIRRKAVRLESLKARFTDFGTRRRFSYENHEMILTMCKKYAPTVFMGTSNPHFAMKFGYNVFGTQAHEWYMVIAALTGFKQANRIAMQRWVNTYNGKLGIALTDTFTSGQFFREFDAGLARLYDGVRQDSGDPVRFAQQAIDHYQSLGIDPQSKMIIFSDNLTVEKIERIQQFCTGKIKSSFGIGTYLTNDVGVEPLNMVIKLTAIDIRGQWVSTVKLSDDPSKHTGTAEAIKLCKNVLGII